MIVIIAILAVITIAAYNGIQSRARASAASSALTQAKRKLELYKVDTTTYPTTGNLATAGITDTTNATYQYTSTTGATYCLTATNGSISYYIDSSTQPTPTQGGCPGHGQGGVAAITNLMTNPSFETGTSAWHAANGATLTRQAASALGYGSYGVRVVPGANTSDSGIGGTATLTAGKTYTFSATVRAIVAGKYSLSTQGVAGAGWANNVTRNMSAGEIYRFSSTWVAGVNGNAAFYIFRPSSSGPSQNSFDVDGMMVVEGTSNAYADGSSPNWAWNGTANLSTSTGPPL